jgi:hypothetical protein
LGGVFVTVFTKDRPGQSILESYVRLHPEMELSGRLGDALPPGQIESPRNRVELKRKGSSIEEESPINVSFPLRVFEDEDMPSEVAALVPAPGWETGVSSGLSREETWEDCLNLARYIASVCKGAAYTGESGLEWPTQTREEGLHHKERSKPTPIDVLTLEWFSHASKAAVRSGQVFLDVLRDEAPGLRPYRFGKWDPLQGQLGPEDDGPFLDAWKAAYSGRETHFEMLSMKSRPPCLSEYVSFPQRRFTRSKGADGVVSLEPRASTLTEDFVKVKIELDVSALGEKAFRERTVRLFTVMAERLESFFAIGYVERGSLSMREGRLVVTGLNEQYPLPSGHEWFGIPPVPTWLSWFGRPYKPLVAAALRKTGPAGVREEEGGIFVRLGEHPADIHQLQVLRFELPGELLARRDDTDDARSKVMKSLAKLGGQMSQYYRAKAAELIPKIDE